MENTKIQMKDPTEFDVEDDRLTELEPIELILERMMDAEPEPEMIEGLPHSDALTPADRYLELFTAVQSSHLFEDSKTFPDCPPKMDPLDILLRYRRIKNHPGFN